jgi:CheY-like chemotaxis protein
MQRKTILLADDDPGMIKILSHILAVEGYIILKESNGAAALSTVRDSRPDLIIIDMNMPFMTGLEALSRLRNEEPRLETPAILLTANDPDDLREKVEPLGRVKLLEKPFDLEELTKLVQDSLGLSGSS